MQKNKHSWETLGAVYLMEFNSLTASCFAYDVKVCYQTNGK